VGEADKVECTLIAIVLGALAVALVAVPVSRA
jgi:hypothetical protein